MNRADRPLDGNGGANQEAHNRGGHPPHLSNHRIKEAAFTDPQLDGTWDNFTKQNGHQAPKT